MHAFYLIIDLSRSSVIAGPSAAATATRIVFSHSSLGTISLALLFFRRCSAASGPWLGP